MKYWVKGKRDAVQSSGKYCGNYICYVIGLYVCADFFFLFMGHQNNGAKQAVNDK